MGRTNRSRKRREENSKAKKARYDVREKERLKKMLGIVDAKDDGADKMDDVAEVVVVKTAKEIKHDKKVEEEAKLALEIEEEREQGEEITVVNEKTGKKHTFNSKTLKDEHGSYPPWYKPKKTAKRMRKLNHARKLKFKQRWTVTNVPL